MEIMNAAKPKNKAAPATPAEELVEVVEVPDDPYTVVPSV